MARASTVRAAYAAPLALLFLLSSAQAHVQVLRGRLVDVVGQSNLVVIGSVEELTPVGARHADATVRVDAVLAGVADTGRLTFRTPTSLTPGARYVLFLRRDGDRLASVAPSGALFPSGREDDAGYRRAIEAIAAALRADPSVRVTELRAALIGTLSASAPPLRYYAALDLATLDHADHPWTSSQRAALERLIADPGADADLRPLLSALLQHSRE